MFTYESTGEASNATLLPEGEYVFMVVEAEGKDSNSGNPMIKLKLAEEGTDARVFDHLVFTANAAWKIDQFRASRGDKLVKGQRVSLPPGTLIGTVVRARTRVKENDEGKKFAEIAAYLVPTEEQPVPNTWRGMKIVAKATMPPGVNRPAQPPASTATPSGGRYYQDRPAPPQRQTATQNMDEERSPYTDKDDGGF